MPTGILLEDADATTRVYLPSAEPGWPTLACSTSPRTGITRCRTADGAIRWRSAAPSRPSKTASFVLRSTQPIGPLVPATLLVEVLVGQGSLVHRDHVSRCDDRADRLVCRN